MKIIKLNATTSTNDYLKQLSKETRVEDFTAVWAENQTAGRGQRGAVFLSEPFKSLTLVFMLMRSQAELRICSF